MGLFSAIADKIFHHHPAATPTAAQPSPAAPAPAADTTVAEPIASPTPSASTPVDVGAVLEDMASKKGGGGNYESSIVDLLKLLDLDSSLTARKELGQELAVDAGENGSAEQNIALHKAVMLKLAENGGKVPDSLKH